MRLYCAAVTFAAAASLGGCGHHEEVSGPTGLAYACADGRSARISYDGGDPNRRPARLSFDSHDYELVPDPAASGLRYRSARGLTAGRALIWAAEGDEAALSDMPLDPAADEGEREIVRCARVREGDAAVAPEHGPDH